MADVTVWRDTMPYLRERDQGSSASASEFSRVIGDARAAIRAHIFSFLRFRMLFCRRNRRLDVGMDAPACEHEDGLRRRPARSHALI